MVDVANKPVEPAVAEAGPRSLELEALEASFGADHGSVAVVTGPRGVGKARLIETFTQRVSQRPKVALLEGRTPEVGGRSFHPFAEIAQAAMQVAEQLGLTDAVIEPIYAGLAAVIEHNEADGDTRPSLDQKLAFFDAFRTLLQGISAHARLALVVHDLENADKDTLELAGYLADELFGDPALNAGGTCQGLLLLSVRTDAVRDRILDFIAEMGERSNVAKLSLEGLDLEGLRKYVQSPHVLEKLLSASDGLPQEIDALIDALPSNVEELFERKLSTLDGPARRTLAALSVANRAASAKTIAEVIQLPVREVAVALKKLKSARIIDRRIHHGELQFSFDRRRDREVTARNLSHEDRALYHGGWANALSQEADSGGPALLAFHQLRSSEPQRGVPLAIQAAETYAVAGAFDAAVHTLEDALTHAKNELRLAILTRLVELAPMTGATRSALRYVDEWKRTLPEAERGHALQKEADLFNALGDYDQALVALDAARRVTPENAFVERAGLEICGSEAFYHLGALGKAEECGRTGLAMLESAQGEEPHRAELELLNQLGKIALADDQLDAAQSLFTETLEIAARMGWLRDQGRARVNLGMAHQKAGASENAEEFLLAAIEDFKQAGDLSWVAYGYMNLGVVAHQRGELGRAFGFYRECRPLFRRLGNRTQLARVLHNLANLYLMCGELSRARAHNDEALRLARLGGVERVVAIATGLEGEILSELGDRESSEAKLREAMKLHSRISVERPLEGMFVLAEFQMRWGETAKADLTLGEAEQVLASVENPLLDARAAFARGSLAGRGDAAIAQLETARAEFERRDRRLSVRDAEIALARCYFAAGQGERARMHVATAQDIQNTVAQDLPEDLQRSFQAARAQRETEIVLAEIEGRSIPQQPAQAPQTVEAPRARTAPRKAEWKSRYAAIIGNSARLNRVFHIIDRVSDSEGTVMIYGESGTGKELVAEAIHKNSPRSKGPFVKLNCAALVETLLLSELFGHERGSFTGAHQRKIGRFEMAAGGTIFLDEIGDISPKTQVALLRVLQEREFERVGGGKPLKVDARIIFATNRNLAQMVKDGTFREDLYYRLKGLSIELPPLRERRDDISELSQHFLAQYAAESATVEKTLAPSAVRLLCQYEWPGNIRELENIVRSVALFAESNVVEARDFDEYRELFQESDTLPPPLPAATPSADSFVPAVAEDHSEDLPITEDVIPQEIERKQAVDGGLLSQIFEQGISLPDLKKQIQAQAIARALRMSQGNITKAAEILGMRRPRLSQIINASPELKSLCQGVSR